MIYHRESEEAVLGTIISHKDSIFRIADMLPEDSFYDEFNQFIYKCCLELANNSTIDLITVVEKAMSKRKTLSIEHQGTNIAHSISILSGKIGSDINLEHHAEILLKYRTIRKLYTMGGEIQKNIDEGMDIDEIISLTADGFNDATSNKSKSEVYINEGLKEFYENQNKALDSKLLPTFIKEIDTIIGGFEYSDLIIIAGAASMGKTSFMLKLLQNLINNDRSVAIFSLEMSNNQLLTRLIAMETEIDIKRIRYNDLDETDWSRINKVIGQYETKKLVMDGATVKLNDVLNKIKKLKIKDDIDIVFIDYLQLVTDSNTKSSREQEVARIARSLKNIAKELNIVVVALSQLSRALTLRDNKRPMLSDLRESGEIEQAADTIMFAFREEYYTMDNPRDIQDAEIIIAKGRNVGLGVAHLKFKPGIVKFISPSENGLFGEALNNADNDEFF